MKVCYTDSLKYKILQRITALPSSVILRSDVQDLGGYRQIGLVLQALQKEKRLVRIGYGIYAKARISPYTKKLVIEDGFVSASREALTKLGVEWQPGSAEQAYNLDKSTQIPVRNIVQLKKRFRRKIYHGDQILQFENNINAK